MSDSVKFDFTGKTVIVTGAERGIGLEIAQGFARCGANIVIAGIMAEEFPNAEKLITAYGVECTCIHTDVSDEASVQSLVKAIKEKYSRIDILVNNAGINKLAPAEEMPLETWQRIIDVNFTGTFLMCREVGSVMLKQGGGNIVNIASMSGLIVNPLPQTQCAYNSSKAGVIMLTKCLANEWAQRGIRVNAIAPGFTRTPLTKKRLDTPNDPAVKKWIEGTPMNRVANPEEMVGLALYYASDLSTFTTGTELMGRRSYITAGLINEEKTHMYLAVWKVNAPDDEVMVDLSKYIRGNADVKMIYPINDGKCGYYYADAIKTLTVKMGKNKYMARLFEINMR